MHINKKDLIEFDNGNMNTQEVIEFLSHLDHCDFCLDQMMEQENNHVKFTSRDFIEEFDYDQLFLENIIL